MKLLTFILAYIMLAAPAAACAYLVSITAQEQILVDFELISRTLERVNASL